MSLEGGPRPSCIFEYLKTLSTNEFDELYNHPPTCLIVFRELKEHAQHVVLRLLLLDQAIPKSIISGWVPKGSQDLLKSSCRDLLDLYILQSIDSNSARGSFRLNKKFQENMKISLLGGGRPLLSDFGSITAEKRPKDAEFLDNYASERWDTILHFMVGSKTDEVSSVVKDVLLKSELMKSGGPGDSIGISQAGFQFLLMDRPTQIMRFILHYFDYLKTQGINIMEAIHFVFQLSFLTVGKSYPIEQLTDTERAMLLIMRELGLAYQRKRAAPRFYVTKLALSFALGSKASSTVLHSVGEAEPDSLFSTTRLPTGISLRSSTDGGGDAGDIGYIVVETNFRVYAYTDSVLKTSLLSLFSKIRIRFPNMIVADITRESVREALLRGISSQQIISFLTSNAHPDMLRQTPILPPTVVDQIRLWELERERFLAQDGCLYEQFTKNTDFEMVRDYAKSRNYLLWECPERRLMVVSKAGHEDVRAFWKQKRSP
nr:general transcription factor IIH polypeptide 4 [Hymenolepis microstoma]